MIISNLAIFVGIEWTARILNIGYHPNFFKEKKINGIHKIEANHQFFWSFFPKSLSRSPQPFQFEKKRAQGVKRIFIFGESAAMGDPEPAFGLSRILETLLENRHSETDFEVINLAVTAINSHVIVSIAKEASDHPSDFWCVYMGNNEVHGQFGPGTIFGRSMSNLNLIRASIALRQTRIGQIANRISASFSKSSPNEWEGVAMFSDQQIFAEDPRLEAVYDNFRSNLKTITEAGLRSGARVILSNVAVNLRDSSPFISASPFHLSKGDRALWERAFQEGKQLFEAGSDGDALIFFRNALRLFDGHAQSHFFVGQCLWNLSDFATAQSHFQKARDLDGLRFRTDGKLNEIIETFAKDFSEKFDDDHNDGDESDDEFDDDHFSQKVRFLNAEALFAYNSAGGIPGEELFWDHVHFRFPGNYLLALGFAIEIEKCLFSKDEIAQFPDWMNLSECAKSLTLTHWADYQSTQSMQRRLRAEPFFSQSVFKDRDARFEEQLRKHRSGISSNSFSKHREIFEKALDKNPKDYILRDLFARYLFSQGKVDLAVKEWGEVVRQVPSHLMAHFHKGRALAKIPERAEEAERDLRQALFIRPETAEILLSLGDALLIQGKNEDAFEQFEAAILLRPNFVEALSGAGEALIGLGKNAEAKGYFERAKGLRLRRGISENSDNFEEKNDK